MQIYILAFFNRQVGLASALAVVLMRAGAGLHPPDPVASRGGTASDRRPPRAYARARRCSCADGGHAAAVRQHVHDRAAPVRAPTRAGLDWPAHPHWGNFVEAFNVANMGAILKSSVLIVLARRAGLARDRHDGRLRARAPPHPGRPAALPAVPARADAAVRGHHHAALLRDRGIGLLNTRWAIILPLIGLFMPFAVFWMRAHFVNMPSELSEAARVDGASTWQLFWRIHVPLARPALASLGDPAVGVDVEPVPARHRPRRGPDAADDGRRARRVPGPVERQHPAAVSRIAADPRADLIVFLIFQRTSSRRLLQGSLKGWSAANVDGTSSPSRQVGLGLLARAQRQIGITSSSCRHRARSVDPSSPSGMPRSGTLSRPTSRLDVLPDALHPGPARRLGRPCHLDRQRDRASTAAGTCSTPASAEHDGGLIQRIGLASVGRPDPLAQASGNPVLEADVAGMSCSIWRAGVISHGVTRGCFVIPATARSRADHGSVAAGPPDGAGVVAHARSRRLSTGRCCRR